MALCPRTGKRGFVSEDLARDELSRLVRTNRDVDRKQRFSLSPYLCEHCHLWHFGHDQRALNVKFPVPVKGKSRHAFGRK